MGDEVENEIARISKIVETIRPLLESEQSEITRIEEQIVNLQFRPITKNSSSVASNKVPLKELLKEKQKVKAKLDKLSNVVNPAAIELLTQLEQDRKKYHMKYEKAKDDEQDVKALIVELDTFREEKVKLHSIKLESISRMY